MKTKDHFQVLGIESFKGERKYKSHFLYNEIRGERYIAKPHKHNFFLFLLFEKGGGSHSIDFVDYPVNDCQMHLLFPGQAHRWELAPSTLAHQLMIDRPAFESFTTSLGFSPILYQKHPVIDLSFEIFNQLLYEFKAIQRELEQLAIVWDIVSLRSRLIAQLVNREAENKFDDWTIYQTKPVLYKYYSLIEANYKKQKSVAFYAEKLHITPNYLNILCGRYFHVSASFLIQNRILLEAKRLIQASEKSIKEIAFELGFSDLAYFSNFFKTQTGVGPRKFRTQF